jgi:hypothetical protein
MTDPRQADNRLRTILSSWHLSPRYRSEALTQHHVRPVPSSHWRELDRELKETGHFAVWQWFLVSFIGFIFSGCSAGAEGERKV